MAFEGINANSLINDLYNCKNNLDPSNVISLSSSITGAGIWQCGSSKVLTNALSKLGNERFKELDSKLDAYIAVAQKIQEYQILEEENKMYESIIIDIQRQISSVQSSFYSDYNMNMDPQAAAMAQAQNRMIINNLENQINQYRSKINQNISKMNSIEAAVRSAV